VDRVYEMKQPKDIIAMMMDKDQFSQWLGIQVNHIDLGSCSLSCTVKKEMLNGFSIAHGGISYALADSTLAFAANSHGVQCYSIETSISHLKKVFEKDILTTTSKEISREDKTGLYHIDVHNQKKELVATLKGTAYVSKIVW